MAAAEQVGPPAPVGVRAPLGFKDIYWTMGIIAHGSAGFQFLGPGGSGLRGLNLHPSAVFFRAGKGVRKRGAVRLAKKSSTLRAV
jgi:hypothetical protein